VRLPRLPTREALIDKLGLPLITFQRWWQLVVKQIESQLAAINQLITDLAAAVADIAAAQAAADAAQGTADSNTTAIAGMDTRLDAAELTVADHETRLDAAEVTIADHETRIDVLEAAGGGGYPPQLGYAGL